MKTYMKFSFTSHEVFELGNRDLKLKIWNGPTKKGIEDFESSDNTHTSQRNSKLAATMNFELCFLEAM